MLASLTSLRFFAALMVVFSHLPGAPFYEGYSGVAFFFVLSGFILSYRYSTAFHEGSVSANEFWIGRFGRIYPLHLLTMLVTFPAAMGQARNASIFLLQLVSQLTLTQAAVPVSSIYFSFDYPSWSLSVEAFFYLLFPLLVKTSSARLAWVLGIVAAYHLALAIAPLDRGAHFLAYIFPPARLGDFVLGILLFRWHEQVPRVTARTATVSQATAVAALIGCYIVAPGVSQALRWDLFYLVPMGVVIFTCAWQNGLVSRCLSRPWLVFLGDASFALYLIHQLVIRLGGWLGLPPAIPISAAYVLISLLLSGLTYFFFEAPARAVVTRRLKDLVLRSQRAVALR